MIYDNVFKQYVALVKKIYLKEDNKYFYKTYFFYDMYMEDFLKRGGNPNIDPDLMAKPFYNSTKRGANNGIIIKESHIEQLLELTKKHHMMSVDYSTEVYENKEQYMQLEKNKWWESKDIIPEDCGQLIDRECQL